MGIFSKKKAANALTLTAFDIDRKSSANITSQLIL